MRISRNIRARRLSVGRLASKAHAIVKDGVFQRILQGNYRTRHGPKLEVISAGPRWSYKGAPIVFVHGAFGAAWMWDEHFLGYFAKFRRRVYAVSLRGHGKSAGHRDLETTSFSDYIDDIIGFIARLGSPPVVVGHSLGGLIVQRLIGRVPLRGIVLMASAPPEGILMVGHSLMLPGPAALMDSFRRTMPGKARSQTDMWRRVLFSDELAAKRVTDFATRMGRESPRALSEARIPSPIEFARSAKIPALVLSAERDVIIEHAMARRTTYYHGATFRKVSWKWSRNDAGREMETNSRNNKRLASGA